MSDYLQQSRGVERGSSVLSHTAYFPSSEASGRGRGYLDSKDWVDFQEVETKERSKNPAAQNRPALPVPKAKVPDALSDLAEAFCSAFTSMSNGIITETADYTKLQQLNQTQTQAVLQSTNNAINKEEEMYKVTNALNKYEQEMGEANEIFGWVMFGVGAALMLACFVSACFTFGATAVAVVPEAEALGAAAEEGGSMSILPELGEEAIELETPDELPAAGDEDVTTEGEAAEDTESEITAANDSGNQSEGILNKQAEESLDKVDSEASKSELSLKEKIAKFFQSKPGRVMRFLGRNGLKMGFAGALGSPMLLKGVTGLIVSDKLEDVVKAQKQVGQALDTMERNKMYFQFLQQLIQREGGTLQDEITSAGEIVSTYSRMIDSYKGITSGLANVV